VGTYFTPLHRAIPSATGSLHKLCVFLQSRIRGKVFNTRPRSRPAIEENLAVHPKAKGDQRRNESDKPILAIPTTANPVLADLLEYYCTQRKFFNIPLPTALWSFVPYENYGD
jgi:hypothetical protein